MRKTNEEEEEEEGEVDAKVKRKAERTPRKVRDRKSIRGKEREELERKGRCGEWLKELVCRQREQSRKEVESLRTKQKSRSAGKFLPFLPLRPGR